MSSLLASSAGAAFATSTFGEVFWLSGRQVFVCSPRQLRTIGSMGSACVFGATPALGRRHRGHFAAVDAPRVSLAETTAALALRRRRPARLYPALSSLRDADHSARRPACIAAAGGTGRHPPICNRRLGCQVSFSSAVPTGGDLSRRWRWRRRWLIRAAFSGVHRRARCSAAAEMPDWRALCALGLLANVEADSWPACTIATMRRRTSSCPLAVGLRACGLSGVFSNDRSSAALTVALACVQAYIERSRCGIFPSCSPLFATGGTNARFRPQGIADFEIRDGGMWPSFKTTPIRPRRGHYGGRSSPCRAPRSVIACTRRRAGGRNGLLNLPTAPG